MAMQTVTFELPEKQLKLIDEIASNLETDRGSVLREVIDAYLADAQQLEAEYDEIERQMDRGNYSTHEQMETRFEDKIRTTKAA